VAAGLSPALRIFGDDDPTKDGTCVRDYIHVEDLADAHVLALRTMQIGPAPSPIYNLGGGGGYSVREVLDTAQLVTGRVIASEVAPPRPGDPPVFRASSDRIKKELRWTPRRQRLDDILDSAWRFMHRSAALAA
jgi:UDP-glucose 4-epimerase